MSGLIYEEEDRRHQEERGSINREGRAPVKVGEKSPASKENQSAEPNGARLKAHVSIATRIREVICRQRRRGRHGPGHGDAQQRPAGEEIGEALKKKSRCPCNGEQADRADQKASSTEPVCNGAGNRGT